MDDFLMTIVPMLSLPKKMDVTIDSEGGHALLSNIKCVFLLINVHSSVKDCS